MTGKARFILLISICVALVLFNILLLVRVSDLSVRNSILDRKMVLSLREQHVLWMHGLEGQDMTPIIRRMCDANSRFAELYDAAHGPKLLLDFPGHGCRRCLFMEMKLLKERREVLEGLGISVIVVFESISDLDFRSMIQQFDVSSISARDEEDHFQKNFEYRTTPLLMLLDARSHVVFANLSSYQEEEDSQAFYSKVEEVGQWMHDLNRDAHR